ncbi:MAG: DUF2178 domain-containing protein [Nanoarchaeota archaeon]|nr:DUF2178 domain-containing protein [Nanoarchaeota archaeon]MBU1622353.1 DUF2178 domain-containing protein [Nanoarchaeota archaeon]
MNTNKIRMIAILIVSILVIITGTLFGIKSYNNNNLGGAILGIIIALIIVIFAILVYKRGNHDLKHGFPLKDERSQKVLEKASSRAFYVSIYLLLAVGFLSDDAINFRDVSQATSLIIGMMALLFLGFWIYYNRK